MVFELSSGNSAGSDADEISELKNRIKSVELDFERRITLIENAAKEMQKAAVSDVPFDTSKSAVIEIQDIKKTLREIEDTGLIAKLETISNSDKIAEATDTLEEVNEKIKLLADAVEILSESRAHGGTDNPAALSDISSIRSEIDSLKNALSKIAPPVDSEKISELDSRVSSLENRDNKTDEDLKKAYETYCEKIALLEQRISSVPVQSEIPKDVLSDMSKLKGDVEKLKNIIKNVVDTLETHSNEHDSGSKSGPETDGEEYKNMSSALVELSMKVAEISREMSLDRAMYPQDITGIKKDMANLRIVQKSLADTLESIAKVKNETVKANYAEDRIKSVNAALIDISGKVSEVSAIREKLNALDGEIKSIKGTMAKSAGIPAGIKANPPAVNQYAENKKFDAIEKTIAVLSEKLGGLQNIKEEITAMNDKINSKGIDSAMAGQKKDCRDNRENDMLLKMIKNIAEENRTLRHEIEQLKQVCTEIMRENRAQPIIID